MKKYILIIAVLFCTSASAQQLDTVKGAIVVKPLVFNAVKKDTVHQVKVERMWASSTDTSVTTYVILYDRKGNQIYEDNIIVPYVFWVASKDKTLVDDYIIKSLGLTKK